MFSRLMCVFSMSLNTFSHVESSGFQSGYMVSGKNQILPHADDLSESLKLQVHLSLRFPQSGGLRQGFFLHHERFDLKCSSNFSLISGQCRLLLGELVNGHDKKIKRLFFNLVMNS